MFDGGSGMTIREDPPPILEIDILVPRRFEANNIVGSCTCEPAAIQRPELAVFLTKSRNPPSGIIDGPLAEILYWRERPFR
jgi:hypothetical protein